MVVNKHLLEDLIKLGLWNSEMKETLMVQNGSIQNIPSIPQELKDLYKTAYEISQRAIIDMSADRGAYICQSQSLNLFMENVTFGKLSSMHFHSWQKGLKTGMYYLRTKAAVDPIKFTLSEKHQRKYVNIIDLPQTDNLSNTVSHQYQQEEINTLIQSTSPIENQEGLSCTMEDGCLMCGS